MRRSLDRFMMFFRLFLAIAVASVGLVRADFKPAINNTLEKGVETECKTCPYTLCTNKAFYTYSTAVTLVCWTRGTRIANDTTWLKTTDGCYVTQYDLASYNGTYETDLSFCGSASTEEHLTFDSTTVQFDSECNLCPDNGECDTVKYLSPGTDLTVTCWTDQGEAVVGDNIWLKTTDNCYVSETGLEDNAKSLNIDNCGPVGFIQTNYTGAYSVGTARIGKKAPKMSKRSANPEPAPIPLPEPIQETTIGSNYLINLTVGEDYAYCHTCANTTCDVQQRYAFNHSVLMQCYVQTNSTDPNDVDWYETTDFCYVREVDFWESLDDQYRFPSCDLFKESE